MKKISQFRIKQSSIKKFRKAKLADSDEWRSYSRKFLSHNPTCYACGARSEATDHMVAHKEKVSLFWKVDNYLPLCHTCHNTITAMFDRHPVPKTAEKLAWIAAKRADLEIFTRVIVVPFDR